jgi:uncharacterized damage-inducible protein DinB
LNAADYWLDFLQKENQCSKKKFEEYKTLKEIGDYMQHVENRMNKYVKPLSPEDLKKKYKGKRNGKVETVTAEDILVHVFEEEVHHRGELIALFWQMGIKPPLIGTRHKTNAHLLQERSQLCFSNIPNIPLLQKLKQTSTSLFNPVFGFAEKL